MKTKDHCGKLAHKHGLPACVLAATLLGLLPAAGSARTVKDQTGRMVNVPENPRRLVSLAPNITEIVYALGLGDELVETRITATFRLKPRASLMLVPW